MGVALLLPAADRSQPDTPGAADGRVLIWTSAVRGEGRSFASSSLVLAQGPRALRWRSTPVCSSSKGGLSQAREKATDILPEPQPSAPGSILRGNLEPTPCRRRGPPVVALEKTLSRR